MSYDSILLHLTMLRDAGRTGGLQRAIAEVVKPGDRVLDFGCGTGVLSIFAERAGAGVVYAVDRSSIIRAAERIGQDSGCTRIQFVAGDGTEVVLPGPVDVIVSEWMGHFLFAEPMLPPLLRLRDQYLAPGGRMIPGRCTLHVALVSTTEHHEQFSFLASSPYGIDFSSVSAWPLHEVHSVKLAPADVLPGAATVGTLDMRTVAGMPALMSGRIEASQPATAYGLCGWFDTDLSPSHKLGTGPHSPATHWSQLYFPFSSPLRLRPGDAVDVELRPLTVAKHTVWSWVATSGHEARRGDNVVHKAWLGRTRPA